MGLPASRMTEWAITMAAWALSCPLAGWQFNNAAQYVNTATFTQATGEPCEAAVEAYTASLVPPTATCELVLNLRAPKFSWRTLSELYTLRKLRVPPHPVGTYSRLVCTERDFQVRWKQLVAPVELDPPFATVLPKAAGISRPFASRVKYTHTHTHTHTHTYICTSSPGRAWCGQSIAPSR